MADRATAGQPYYTSPLFASASAANRALEAGNDYAARKRLSEGGTNLSQRHHASESESHHLTHS